MPADKALFRRKRVRISLIILLLLVMMVVYFSIVAIDRPPLIEDMSALNLQRTDHGNNLYSFGSSWLRKDESGLWEAYIEGNAFERGVAFGQLTKELLYYQESSFFEQIRELVPSDRYLKVLKYFIAFFNRNLDRCVTEEYKQEIYGTSFACDHSYDFIGSGYQRQLNYHAAHDIGHALQGLHLVACTSFSVWDSKSADSSLLIGRNFDFYMGEKFAENKIVCFVNPDSGYRFMMITWADLIGVVSGMNEKGLTVTLNAAKSGIPLKAATPVTLLAREILQYASNIKEAWDIAVKRNIFVSEAIMIGSAADHQTVIIEKSPRHTALFDPEGERIICSNHYQSDYFATDKKNIENIRESDSYERYQRVEELLNRFKTVNEYEAAEILRDRLVMGDSDAGLGNELAINQMIAHHSVIFKPDSLIVWVSTSPWQSGQYVAYDLKKFFGGEKGFTGAEIHRPSATIPADNFLFTPDYNNLVNYRELSKQLRLLKNTRENIPHGFVEEYIRTNPKLYQTYVNLAEYYDKTNNHEESLKYYNMALHCKLPGLGKKQELTAMVEKLSKKVKNGTSQD